MIKMLYKGLYITDEYSGQQLVPPKRIPRLWYTLVHRYKYWVEPFSLESIYRLCVLEWSVLDATNYILLHCI